jgi:signal transduction histidine kinase
MPKPILGEFAPQNQLVLIVDDKPKNLQLLGNVLGNEGYRVAIAMNGDQALRSVHQNVPDLILLDVMMPEMDGYTVCRTLHESASMRRVPVIFLSARSSAEDVMQGFKEGGVDYITKPFQIEEVLARVRVHLQLKWTRERLDEYNSNLEDMLESRTEELIKSERQAVFGLMVQGIVHNLKTPLMGLQSGPDLIRVHIQKLRTLISPLAADDKDLALKHLKSIEDSVGIIAHAGISMNDIVHSLLVKSRVDKAADVVTMDLNRIIEAEVNFMQADLTFKHGIAKAVNLSRDALMIQVVPGEISQVIHNLIRNSLDAMQGTTGPALEIETHSIGNAAVMSVKDNGSGIPSDILPRVFEPFFTTKPVDPGSGKPSGTGLGLHTCKQIVETYGGEIAIQSDVDVGTTITVKLPMVEAPVAAKH